MKPILNREKQSVQPKTANIEIKKGEGDNRTMAKRKSNIEVETFNEIYDDFEILFDLDM